MLEPNQPKTMVSLAAGGLSSELSEKIKIARIVCIFLMTYTHVVGAFYLQGADGAATTFDHVRLFVIDTLGRASVPLLSIISAYIACRLPQASTFIDRALRKARSLLVPMVAWSLPFLAFALMREALDPGAFRLTRGFDPTPVNIFLSIIAVTKEAPNPILTFLRDIFVLSLFTPALAALMRRWPAALLAFGAAVSIWQPQIVVLDRPQILFFYLLGLWLAIDQTERWRALTRWTPWILAAFVGFGAPFVMLHVHVLQTGDPMAEKLFETLQTVYRMLGVATFWIVADWIYASRLKGFFIALEPFAFFLFCSHMFVFRMFWEVWNRQAGGDLADFYAGVASPYYPLFYALSPPAALALAVAGALVLGAVWPALFRVLNGGRDLRQRRLAPA